MKIQTEDFGSHPFRDERPDRLGFAVLVLVALVFGIGVVAEIASALG